MDEETKKLLMNSILSEKPSSDDIDSADLWNKVKLRSNLRYNEDFVLVSSKVWNFLYDLFGGGMSNFTMRVVSSPRGDLRAF